MKLALAYLTAAALFSAPTIAFAQPSSIYGRDVTQGVYVRDSAIAVEKFAQAERLEHLKEWSKAADVYQDVVNSFSDRVVPSRTDPKTQNIIQYSSVLNAVQERLSHWPEDGLSAYRARYEPDAQALLDAAKPGDFTALHKIYTTYFVTDSARIAGTRLVDAYFESGEFSAAAWIADHLLTLHPSVRAGSPAAATERPRLLFRAGLAYHFAGYDSRAKAKQEELARDFADALGKVRGADVRFADALDEELKLPRPAIASAASASSTSSTGLLSESWPMIFGSADRSRLSPAVSQIGQKLFTIDLGKFESMIPRAQRQLVEPQNNTSRDMGTMTGAFPTLDRDDLFFQDNAKVYAISLETGLPLPGWSQTYDGDRNGRYVSPGLIVPMPRNQHCTVSVTDDSVLAILGQSDAVAMVQIGKAVLHDTRLVCLDRRTGMERWIVRPRTLVNAEEPNTAALRELDFSGSPLVVGDRVYVIGRGGKAIGFEDCYVICLDADTGKLRWSSAIASANTGNQLLDLDPADGGSAQNTSHLAYAAGRVYCATNLGAVAALDAYDGSIAWLNLYQRQPPDMGAMIWRRAQINATNPAGVDKPWAYNPVIVSGGKVYVLPGDGLEGYIYDAANGEQLKSIPLKMRTKAVNPNQPHNVDSTETMRALLAVLDGGRIVMASNRSVVCVDTQALDPKNPRAALRWAKTYESGGDRQATGVGAGVAVGNLSQRSTILGRPFVSSQHVFVPTAWALEMISLQDGTAANKGYPEGESWPRDEGPGNVLATREHVILAGPTRVTVYTDPIAGARRLDAAVAASPTDPEPRLRYAELLFVSKKYDQVLARLDEAIGLLGGANALAVGPNRDRLFGDTIAFAQKLMRDARGGNGGRMDNTLPANVRDIIKSLFDRAADAASSPSQQVSYRLARADHMRLLADPAGELRLYQEILSDPQWRSVIVSRGTAATITSAPNKPAEANSATDSNGPRQAGAVATAAIGELLRRPDGKSLYEPIERRASAALSAARGANDADALVAVAQTYPNADAAREAMLLAADAYETSGNPRAAVQTLRQLYARSGTANAVDRARLLEAMARNYLAMPNRLEVAASRLAQAAKLAPSDTKLARPMRLRPTNDNTAPPADADLVKDVTLAAALDSIRSRQSNQMDRSLPELAIPKNGKPSAFVKQDGADAPATTVQNVKALLVPPRDSMRFDRVVAMGDPGKGAAGLSVYAVGSTTPLFTSSAFGEAEVHGCAWAGGNLIAWSDDRLAMLDGENGKTVWQLSPASLPRMETFGGGGGADALADGSDPGLAGDENDPLAIANAGPNQMGDIQIGGAQVRRLRGMQQVVIVDGRGRLAGQQIRVQRGMQLRMARNANGVFVVQGGRAIGPGVEPPKKEDANPGRPADAIVAIVPLSDRVIFATADGRIAAAALLDGRVLWQARPARAEVDKLLANDDFVVARIEDPSAGGSRLIAFDASSGAVVFRRSFTPDATNGGGTLPINLALADDGMLVWTLPDRIVGKDLFEPGEGLRFGRDSLAIDPNTERPPFADMSGVDQLSIVGTRIFAVVDGGSGVRVFSLETGDMLKANNRNALRLGTGTKDVTSEVTLRAVGSMLYVIAPKLITAYELESLRPTWTMNTDELTNATLRDVLIGRSALVAVAEAKVRRRPAPAGGGGAPGAQKPPAQPPVPGAVDPLPTAVRILVHSRDEIVAKGEKREGGMLIANTTEPAPSGVVRSQAVNGGIYYLTGDQKLHFLAGADAKK